MRQIKFRAFFRDNKEMVKVGAMDWDEKGNLICLNYPKGKDYFNSDSEDDNDIVLMQYTGCKDKNGQEIYEGDVVEFYGELFEVMWLLSGFYISNIAGGGFEEVATNGGDMRVVGNIYENRELLIRTADIDEVENY